LLFKLLIFVALVGGLIYIVRKFMSNSSSKRPGGIRRAAVVEPHPGQP
ncbi:DUF5326 family protein, partial [Streptomyces sp. 900105755]